MPSYGVTLLSGGLDSTTVAAHACRSTDHLTALTFYYGQSHGKEIECAARVAEALGIERKLVDISFLGSVAWYSALTNPQQFPVPEDRPVGGMAASIPITYVPVRNTIFLSLAAAYLESKVLYALEVEGVSPSDAQAVLFMGPNAIDYSGYPDCRPEYFEKMRESLAYGSKLWAEYRVPMEIETPIIQMSKKEIVQLGLETQAPLDLTWSCYQAGDVPCGRCDSCVLRAKGFREAGVADPALERLKAG